MGDGWKEREVSLRNAPEPEERWPAKLKTGKGGGKWLIESSWDSVLLYHEASWMKRRYRDERSARFAFENGKLKTFGPDRRRLVDPDGKVVEEWARPSK